LAASIIALGVLYGRSSSATAQPLPTPNPIYDGSQVMKLINQTDASDKTHQGELYQIATEDNVNMWVLHTWGTHVEMAYTHGYLMAPMLNTFVKVALPEFFKSQLAQIPIKKLPKWLQKIIANAENKDAVSLFETLLSAIFYREEKFIQKSKSGAMEEMAALAEGYCASGIEGSQCDEKKFLRLIQNMNMIPELVKMTCSMFGAWGSATPDGKLIQLRSLDFGSGPFANYTLLTARHPTDGGNDFVAVGFPGWSGAVTGFSTKVALSEKVWETYNGTGIQEGQYDGEPDALVIRDIMQFANNIDDAVAFTEGITRTWAIFIGVGEVDGGQFRALGYRKKNLQVFGPDNISSVTHAPAFDDVVYIDKHPQPSHDNVTMPALMAKYHGSLDYSAAVQYIPRVMQSGDMHVAVYDFGARQAYVSVGLVTADGNYGKDGISGKACNRPYIKFDMDDMLLKQPPASLE